MVLIWTGTVDTLWRYGQKEGGGWWLPHLEAMAECGDFVQKWQFRPNSNVLYCKQQGHSCTIFRKVSKKYNTIFCSIGVLVHCYHLHLFNVPLIKDVSHHWFQNWVILPGYTIQVLVQIVMQWWISGPCCYLLLLVTYNSHGCCNTMFFWGTSHL